MTEKSSLCGVHDKISITVDSILYGFASKRIQGFNDQRVVLRTPPSTPLPAQTSTNRSTRFSAPHLLSAPAIEAATKAIAPVKFHEIKAEVITFPWMRTQGDFGAGGGGG